jgi:hypothetical protein
MAIATESHRGYEGRREPDILCVSLFLCGSLWAKFKNDLLLNFADKLCRVIFAPERWFHREAYGSERSNAAVLSHWDPYGKNR